MRALAFLSAIMLLLAVADAQVDHRKPMPPIVGPQLIAQQGKTETPLSITKADLRIVIDGYLAETTTTLTFSNPNDRVLEGDLRFPLPEGATVSGFGLDVNGQLVDGVPVEKHEARITYETELRKGIDPGLMEHVAGDNYRTRIYPIPARGTRTVRVQYVSELFATPDGLNYLLPLQWGQSVGEMNLKVEVLGTPGEPKLTGPADMQAAKADGRTVYQRTYRDVQFKGDLRVAIPGLPRQRVSVEKRIAEAGVQHYFLVSDLPASDAVDVDRASPRAIAILWDASLSRAAADKDRELKLLAGFLKQCNGTQVEVIRFSNAAEPPRSFKINGADDGGLIAYLKETSYDGATDLSKLAMPQGAEYALLFSDGNGNLGPAMPEKLPVPVYTISSDSRANHAILAAIGERSGGAYANLTRMDDAQAIALLGHQPYALLSVKVDEGEVNIVPSHPQPAIGRVVVAGKLASPAAKLTLNYGHGTRITSSATVVLSQAGAAEGSLVPRAWAQRRIAELAVEEQKNHDAILALGREFGVVTPNTSLLVLETLEQYLQYKITPPKTREEMYVAYQKKIGEQKQQEQKQAADKIERVAKMWNERVAWWEKAYKYPDNFKYVAPPEAKPEGLTRGGGGGGGAWAANGVHPTPDRAPAPAPGIHPPDTAAPTTPAQAEARRDELRANDPHPTGGEADGVQAYVSDLQAVGASASHARNSLGFDGAKGGRETTATISIKPWNPETPYLIKLRLAKPEDAYSVYLKERVASASPAFYLDCANFFIEKNQRDIGIRILTNIAELELDSPALLRVAAYRLAQVGEYSLAIDLFEKVLRLRPEEPQSHRDLALALIARAEGPQKEGSTLVADYTRALELLNHVVMHTYDRFPEIETIALMEANRVWSRMQQIPLGGQLPPNPIDKRLVKLLDCEVRIVLTWDADLTDLDLWVTEPSGELCMYDHNRTTIGGRLSNDFTQGYGPEEYCLRKAMKGQYKIQANFYGSRQQSLSGPATLQAEVITNFGRPNEKRQAITLRLEKAKDVVDVGTIVIE
jgi:tetratricopeptide (TPR) repeat protein